MEVGEGGRGMAGEDRTLVRLGGCLMRDGGVSASWFLILGGRVSGLVTGLARIGTYQLDIRPFIVCTRTYTVISSDQKRESDEFAFGCFRAWLCTILQHVVLSLLEGSLMRRLIPRSAADGVFLPLRYVWKRHGEKNDLKKRGNIGCYSAVL